MSQQRQAELEMARLAKEKEEEETRQQTLLMKKEKDIQKKAIKKERQKLRTTCKVHSCCCCCCCRPTCCCFFQPGVPSPTSSVFRYRVSFLKPGETRGNIFVVVASRNWFFSLARCFSASRLTLKWCFDSFFFFFFNVTNLSGWAARWERGGQTVLHAHAHRPKCSCAHVRVNGAVSMLAP